MKFVQAVLISVLILGADARLYADVLPTTSIVFDGSSGGNHATINDALWDFTRQRFFFSLGRNVSFSLNRTRIAIVNPTTAVEEASILTADVPNHIAISDDGQFLY